jgi:putative nucleotidyltransferase with HDIG domain
LLAILEFGGVKVLEILVVNGLIQLLKKDVDTYEHCLRVGKMAKIMASYLGFNEEQSRKLVMGCCLHDIGKILIPNEILKKRLSLTADEWAIMKRHSSLGVQLAREAGIVDQEIMDSILFHHERWDGLGYPFGLSGEAIPPVARICSIIDAFDCMVSDRPYRTALSVQQAKQELLHQSDKQFEKSYVQVFLSIPEQRFMQTERLPTLLIT